MMVFAYNHGRVELLIARLIGQYSEKRRHQTRTMDAIHTDASSIAEAPSHEPVSLSDPGNVLMLALQSGDRTALRKLMSLYNDRLYTFTVRIVRHSETAEDIVQETWLSLYESRDRYQTTYRFSTWLFTIARRKALSELRRRKVRSIVRSLTGQRDGEEETTLEVPQETFRQPDAEASGALLSEIIERALARLTPAQREVIVLRDIEGMENEEVAEILGWDLKPGAIRKRVFDAREAFRKEMIALGVRE
ncbi:MAG: RNA polymerase sigma factor [Candidatus Kapaibacterium sp.]